MPLGILTETPLDELLLNARLPPRGSRLTPEQCKQLALLWAYQGLGHVSPNPLVGAVIVDRDHKFIAAGAHLTYGKGHAEINALEAVKGCDLAGATMYVTLEPCAHEGRTPPCAKRLAAEKVNRIVFGATDPNPLVQGKGAALLRSSGKQVEQDPVWGREVAKQNRTFFFNMQSRQIFYALKCATSLDGSIAREGDRRQFITNERARAFGHVLRMCYDAIIVGWRTVLLDNPTLNVRFGFDRPRTPIRIVLDPDARCAEALADGRLNLAVSEPERTIWITAAESASLDEVEKSARLSGLQIVRLPWSKEGGFPLTKLSDILWDKGVRSALIEGGAQTYRMFLEQRKVNHLHHFQAPRILTGDNRLPWNATLTGREQITIAVPEMTLLEDNWLVEGPLVWQRVEEPC